ncbi:MAG TPA: GAF domain-containing protein [Blastocatellia bacterium]
MRLNVPTGLIQTNSTAAVAIAILVAILVIAIIIVLFLRYLARQKEREKQARERLLQMEREAQFASAVDGVKYSRNANQVAADIAAVLREHLSIPVLAIFAGRETDGSLIDVLQTSSRLPDSVPSMLLKECTQPIVEKLSLLTSYRGSDSSNSRQAADQYASLEEFELDQIAPSQGGEYVLLVPWRGPFGWNGLIVASNPAAMPAEAIGRYREPLSRLTEKLAVALQFEGADAELQSTKQIVSRTSFFSRSLISCLEATSPLDSIVREVTAHTGSDSAALWRIDESTSMVKIAASHGLKSAEFLPLPLGQGLAGSVVQTSEVLALEDAPADQRCIFPREARESGIVSYMGVPLSSDGNAIGVLEIHFASHHSWTDSERSAIESAAPIVSEVLKSLDSRGNRLKVESAYLGLSEALQRLRTPDELKEAVVEVLGHALGASRVVVVELNGQGQPQPVKEEYRQPTVKSALGVTFAEALASRVQASQRSQAISDSREHSLTGSETAKELGVLSELAVPVRLDGKTRSIVYVHQCDRAREWRRDEIEFTERVVSQLSLSLTNLGLIEMAFNDAQQARAEARQVEQAANSARIHELERRLEDLDHQLADARSGEKQALEMYTKASALEANLRAEADSLRRAEAEAQSHLERAVQDHKQAQGSAQQLLEINRLKSEFIVNAGHEIEASLQSVLGLSELLDRGVFGDLTRDQKETVQSVYAWAQRIKSDVDWLIEYGSTRSRRLESPGVEKSA